MEDAKRPRVDLIKCLVAAGFLLFIVFASLGVFTRERPAYTLADQIRDWIHTSFKKKEKPPWPDVRHLPVSRRVSR